MREVAGPLRPHLGPEICQSFWVVRSSARHQRRSQLRSWSPYWWSRNPFTVARWACGESAFGAVGCDARGTRLSNRGGLRSSRSLAVSAMTTNYARASILAIRAPIGGRDPVLPRYEPSLQLRLGLVPVRLVGSAFSGLGDVVGALSDHLLHDLGGRCLPRHRA